MTAKLWIPQNPALDRILTFIGEALELTPKQRQRAREEYEKVARWLARPLSILAVFNPQVYPQGSTRTRTETRPLPGANGDARQHDVDAVAEYQPSHLNAMQLYEATFNELRANPEYTHRLVRKKRCIRLPFVDDFHLDILPARTDPSGNGNGRIEIPDRQLRDWVSSNPKGYAAWFDQRAEAARVRYVESLGLEGFPTHAQKPTLSRAVQLWKRRRDVLLRGSDRAPRSIILTTLAAQHYGGEPEVIDAFVGILDRTVDAIRRQHPKRIAVLNPTNHKEDFSESWDDVAYRAFTRLVEQCGQDVQELRDMSGLPRLVEVLRKLFGVDVADLAFDRYRTEMREAGEGTTPKMSIVPGVGLVAERAARTIPVPRSTHFGG